MGDFEDGLAALERLTSQADLAPTGALAAALSREQLLGASFRPGDRVRDPVTGREGKVVHTTFARVPGQAPGR
jgi:hypothetical protein